MNINERIKEIRRIIFNNSTKDFAIALNVSSQAISNYIRNGYNVGREVIENILRVCPSVNSNWLLTGEGEMLKTDSDISNPIKTRNQGVPYYNVDFIGGFDLVENDQTTTPDYYIDFQKYNNADCWCNVTGHSMEPSISHGDIIALKEIIDWRVFLPFGEIYAIVTSEHRTIKKVTGSLNPERLLLIPLNPNIEFQPQEIPISIIIRVYKVLGCVKKF